MSPSDPTPQPLDLEAIKKRTEEATPGPWSVGHGWVFTDPIYPDDNRLANVLGMKFVDVERMEDEAARVRRNVEFIAHAREDVPLLLAALEEARRERDDAIRARDQHWRELDMVNGFWTDLSNEVLKNAPEDYDGDEAADAIAVRYVRDLESQLAALRSSVERAEQERDQAQRGMAREAKRADFLVEQLATEHKERQAWQLAYDRDVQQARPVMAAAKTWRDARRRLDGDPTREAVIERANAGAALAAAVDTYEAKEYTE